MWNTQRTELNTRIVSGNGDSSEYIEMRMYLSRDIYNVYYRAVHMDVLEPQRWTVHTPTRHETTLELTHTQWQTIDTGAAVNDAVGAAAARMGLQQHRPEVRGAIWASVNIVHEHETNFSVNRKNCNKSFCGDATRIEAHIHHPQRLHLTTCDDGMRRCVVEYRSDAPIAWRGSVVRLCDW
jgi:hypothetical protein